MKDPAPDAVTGSAAPGSARATDDPGGDPPLDGETAPPTATTRVRGRRRTRRTHDRRAWWIAGGVLALLGLLALGLDVYERYLPAARALREGRDAATQAQEILRGNPDLLDHARLAQAQQLLQTAAADFSDRSAIVDAGWIPSLASHLPLFGDQVAALRGLRHTGAVACRLGLDVIPIVDGALAPAGAPAGGTLTRVTAVAEAHQGDLNRILAELDALGSAAAEIPPTASLIGPLSTGRSILERDLPRIQDGLRPAIGLLRLLPPAVGGTHRYLLLLDNPAEQRPGGGFIGSVGEVTVTDGAVTSQTFQSSDFADALTEKVPAPRALADYLYGTHPWTLSDANWSPDFPTSVEQITKFYKQATGHTVDGVIGVDPVVLGEVLKVIGPVQVPPYSQVVTSQDTLLVLNEIINSARPGDPGKAYLAPFGAAMLDKLVHAPLSQSGGLASALTEGAVQKHVVMFFRDAALQAAVDGAGYGGRVSSPQSDALLIVDANLSGSKADLVVERSYSLSATVSADGEVNDTLTLVYHNPIQTDPAVLSLDRSYDGAYHDYLRVYLPETAHLDSISLANGGPAVGVAPEAVDYELHREAVGFFLVVPPGGGATLTLRYSGPFADVSQGTGVHYILQWSKQIGAGNYAEAVSVNTPSGARAFKMDSAKDQVVDVRAQ